MREARRGDGQYATVVAFRAFLLAVFPFRQREAYNDTNINTNYELISFLVRLYLNSPFRYPQGAWTTYNVLA